MGERQTHFSKRPKIEETKQTLTYVVVRIESIIFFFTEGREPAIPSVLIKITLKKKKRHTHFDLTKKILAAVVCQVASGDIRARRNAL